jgi:hypothetical protein
LSALIIDLMQQISTIDRVQRPNHWPAATTPQLGPQGSGGTMDWILWNHTIPRSIARKDSHTQCR